MTGGQYQGTYMAKERAVFSEKGLEPGETQCFPIKYFYTHQTSQK